MSRVDRVRPVDPARPADPGGVAPDIGHVGYHFSWIDESERAEARARPGVSERLPDGV
ncbi:hypothetical protein [Planosporangium mesophilum]|uniref:Uncharacterized protein n=1 Tax=Planosporangium mesophilum TaxID=689768 RepID=A0A8J3X2B2_9ACTN|nr:hypothetical protein [Planosporangium mesophilum]NJC84783.1 hypothetical protein [Planosporangium mesophilum]GII24199.1 hypothetical protein Pme01_37960 [Planosporangium mesophilum]